MSTHRGGVVALVAQERLYTVCEARIPVRVFIVVVHKHVADVAELLIDAVGWPGIGNMDLDPMFVDAVNGDIRLNAGSPCRDRGDNADLPSDAADLSRNGNRTETLPRDLALRGRVEGTTVDMGAFEAP